MQNTEILHKNKGYTDFSTTIDTVTLKKKGYDCYEDNSMNMKECIDEYIAEEMECNLPWAKQHSTKELDVCSGAEKLSLFRNISFYITNVEFKNRIKKKGCFKPNCLKRKWQKSYWEMFDSWMENKTLILQGLPESATTILRKEMRLADFSTFVADCGSYLGLFLGASILSLSDIGISLVKKLIKLMTLKKKEHRNISLI